MLARLASAALACAVLAPCSHADIEFFDFNLGGVQEVPPVSTPAFGFASLEFDPDAMTFDLDLFIDGISLDSITGAHIHRGAFGTNGPVIVDLLDLSDFLDAGDGVGFLSVVDIPLGGAFTPAQLRTSMLYVNVHTRAHPNGEIRGQIPTPAATLPLIAAAYFSRRRRR